jgi:hypothetical protein
MKRLLPHDYAGRAPIERRCAALWRCGPRALSLFLDALAVEHGIADEIDAKLHEYGRLDPDVVAAVGADRFAPAPMRIAGSEP